MGCHTWFYKRVDRTIEEARAKYIANLEESIVDFTKILNDPNDECRLAYEWDNELIQHSIDIWNRQLRMVKSNLCNVAVFNKQPNDDGRLYQYENGNLYCYNDDLPHDIFRIGEYPEDKLFSLDETLKYLEDHSDKIHYASTIFEKKSEVVLKRKAIEELKKFWEEYPDGMIEFG